MSDSDKMRQEFETWAGAVGFDLTQTKGDDRYWYVSTESAWEAWQAAYQAGQKAEREAIFIEWENGEIMAAEVERLRAELAAANTRTHAEKQNRSVEVNGAVRLLKESREEVERLREENEWMGIAGQQMARHLAEAKAELAAAKAASVCPVEIAALGDADWEYSVGVKCKSDDDANKLFDWLWERMKDTPPHAT